jgi:hypothetical protein
MVRFLAKAVLLVLFLLVAAPSVQAAEPREVSWSLLGDLWASLTGAWGDNGCELDPDGRCAPRQGTAFADNGCEVDPNGRCAPRKTTAYSDNGCELDPSGGCRR